MMTISCGRARRLLWPDAGVRDASPEVVAAREHVRECVHCREFFAQSDPVPEALRELAVRDVAPLEVRQRLFAAIAEARTQSPKRRDIRSSLIVAAIAAAAVLVVSLTANRFEKPGADLSVAAAVAADHGQWLHGGGINSGANAEVSRWIADRVPFAVDVPAFPSAKLRGGRIARIEERQAAVMEYELGGEAMSYFVVQLNGVKKAGNSERLIHSRLEGYQLVMWREPGLLHVLVGRVPTSTLDQLALMCIAEMRKASKV